MLITRNNRWSSGVRKHTVERELKIGPLSVKFITIAIIAMASLFYLAQSTHASAQKYQLMQMSQTQKELETKGKDLEVEAARLKSLNEIKKSATGLGLEAQSQ